MRHRSAPLGNEIREQEPPLASGEASLVKDGIAGLQADPSGEEHLYLHPDAPPTVLWR